MIYLVASIILSVLLLLNFRLFPRFGVNTTQAIVFNYPVCFLTGLLLMPAGQSFSIDFTQTWTWLALILGVGFIVTFLLSGASTQRSGITATSLANNLSLVIPVTFSLLVLGGGKVFDALNYLGLALALVAVGLSTYKKSESGTNTGSNLWLPVAVFLMYGFTNTTINYMNVRYITAADQTVAVTLTMVLGAIVAGAVLLAIRLVRGQERIEARSFVAAVTLGVPNYLSFYTLILALSAYSGNGAFVYPVYNIGVILLAAGTAALFFREQLSGLNKVGLALAVLAIALISWQELSALLA
ncbi:EamA/RhaT family transporter [Rudanella paleaurantiibacter]|uniref:EamA/RhaT family transporter n=1 Tax=Rudanella paleaurantiibacter TaxID=2614655 RepID=A0A7J5U2P7_9BACT|nr:EamA/RhaT family transporter [Rudanella paleaurantiibacter]KAB7732073.1 EamA/RhaT family transporter [Rudanella paleaurantiibacter]